MQFHNYEKECAFYVVYDLWMCRYSEQRYPSPKAKNILCISYILV